MPATGAVRDVLEEKVETFFESGNGRVNWRYLPGVERGDLVLASATTGATSISTTSQTGKLKNRDHERRRQRHAAAARRREEPACSTSSASARRTGRDPYFRHFYRIGMDGKGLQLLTPEDADHDVSLSPSGKYFVDSYSKPDVPPVAVLRDADGKLVADAREGRHLAAAGDRLEAADADHGEGARRRRPISTA